MAAGTCCSRRQRAPTARRLWFARALTTPALQNYAAYTEADHDTYRRSVRAPELAAAGPGSQAFIDALFSWASATDPALR